MQSSFSDQLWLPGFLSSTATPSMSTGEKSLSKPSQLQNTFLDGVSLMSYLSVTLSPCVLCLPCPPSCLFHLPGYTYQNLFCSITLLNTKLSVQVPSLQQQRWILVFSIKETLLEEYCAGHNRKTGESGSNSHTVKNQSQNCTAQLACLQPLLAKHPNTELCITVSTSSEI